MQREVPGDPGAGTSSYWVMPNNTATKISTIFQDRVITELTYLLISAAMVSMMFRCLICIHFFYYFLAIPLYHEFYLGLTVIFTSPFRTLLTSDNNSSKTSQWNIMKFNLPTLKHLVIQLAKLQIYTLNLTTTFWHCKKKTHYFWTGVYYFLWSVVPSILTGGNWPYLYSCCCFIAGNLYKWLLWLTICDHLGTCIRCNI